MTKLGYTTLPVEEVEYQEAVLHPLPRQHVPPNTKGIINLNGQFFGSFSPSRHVEEAVGRHVEEAVGSHGEAFEPGHRPGATESPKGPKVLQKSSRGSFPNRQCQRASHNELRTTMRSLTFKVVHPVLSLELPNFVMDAICVNSASTIQYSTK